MTASVRNDEVAAFVAAVRGELDDLAPDEIEELTGGLEADLDDAVADGGVEHLGSAAAYAAELRAAAGLPPRATRGGGRGAGSIVGTAEALQRRVNHRIERLRAQSWWPGVSGFFVTLRPFWWVVRAWVAWVCVNVLLGVRSGIPSGLMGLLTLALFVVVSVELGRRQFAARGRGQRGLIRAGNVIAVLFLLPAMAAGQNQFVAYYPVTQAPPQNGLWLDGTEVRNVFPYDAQGKPLTDVQLFDENGRSLNVGDSARTPLMVTQTAAGDATEYTAQVPVVDANNHQQWNVFPLRQQVVQDATDPASGGSTQSPVGPPMAASLPLHTTLPVVPPAASTASPSPTSPPSPTSAPSAGSAPSATTAPTPSAAPSRTP